MAGYSTALSNQPKVSYLTADHLGSPRIITDGNGKVISRHDYLAFGDEVTDTVGNVGGRSSTNGYGVEDDIRKQYTGYEKDEESGLDFAQARYYNGKQGRFTSVDPLVASANVKDPQTFNRYSYGLNSPYKFTDSLGLVATGVGQGSSSGGDVSHSHLRNSKGMSLDFPFKEANEDIEPLTDPNANATAQWVVLDEKVETLPAETQTAVASNTQTYSTFNIYASDGTTSASYNTTTVTLPKSFTDHFSSQGVDFFNHGIEESANFNAAIIAIDGTMMVLERMILNNLITGAKAVQITDLLLNLKATRDAAILGSPIVDMTGSGFSIGASALGFGGSGGLTAARAAVDAVSTYNKSLTTTDSMLIKGAVKFASNDKGMFGATSVKVVPASRGRTVEINLPLDSGTLQNLFKGRMTIARNAGRVAVK